MGPASLARSARKKERIGRGGQMASRRERVGARTKKGEVSVGALAQTTHAMLGRATVKD